MLGEALVVGTVAAAGRGPARCRRSRRSSVTCWSRAGFEPPGVRGARSAGLPLAAPFAAGLVVALLGAWSASRRAARVGPLEALREAAVDERPCRAADGCPGRLHGRRARGGRRGRHRGGAELMNLALRRVGPDRGADPARPRRGPAVVRLVTWPLARRAGPPACWSGGLLAAVRRTASTAAPVLATVGFAVLITGMVQTMAAAFAAERARRQAGGS